MQRSQRQVDIHDSGPKCRGIQDLLSGAADSCCYGLAPRQSSHQGSCVCQPRCCENAFFLVFRCQSHICARLYRLKKPEAGDFSYSGMHDTGPLVKPVEGGVIASLIAAVQQAKDHNDTFLTRIIEAEKNSAEPRPEKKRFKTDDT